MTLGYFVDKDHVRCIVSYLLSLRTQACESFEAFKTIGSVKKFQGGKPIFQEIEGV